MKDFPASIEGDDSDHGLATQRDTFPTAKARPSAQSTPLLRDAQKPWCGHRQCGRPADYLPPGTVGQWPSATGQWWNAQMGGDPKTHQRRRGLTHNSRAGNPKRMRPNCHSKEVNSNQRGCHHCTKWPKGQEPWSRGATGFCKLSRQLLVPASCERFLWRCDDTCILTREVLCTTEVPQCQYIDRIVDVSVYCNTKYDPSEQCTCRQHRRRWRLLQRQSSMIQKDGRDPPSAVH